MLIYFSGSQSISYDNWILASLALFSGFLLLLFEQDEGRTEPAGSMRVAGGWWKCGEDEGGACPSAGGRRCSVVLPPSEQGLAADFTGMPHREEV